MRTGWAPRPGHADYLRKFEALTEGLIELDEARRFLDFVQCLPSLGAADLIGLNVAVP